MRLEHKYLVPNELAMELRARLSPFVRMDRYSEEGDPREYTVRTIYFDTPSLDYYHEKLEGLRSRKKIRIRGYGRLAGNPTVFLEIKRKEGARITKDRAPLLYEHVRDIFHCGDVARYVIPDAAFPGAVEDAGRFLFQVHRYHLCPSILTIYAREAYYGSCHHALRITLDKDLRSSISPSLSELFSDHGARRALPSHSILEVKFRGGFPSWLAAVTETMQLRPLALSKYAICLDDHSVRTTSSGRSTFALARPFPIQV